MLFSEDPYLLTLAILANYDFFKVNLNRANSILISFLLDFLKSVVFSGRSWSIIVALAFHLGTIPL